MASKCRNMFYENKKQETTEIGKRGSDVSPFDSASKGDTMSMVSTVDNDDMGPQLHDGADELMRESEAFEKLLTIGLPTLDQIALKSGHEEGSGSHDERSDQLETSSYLMPADSTAIDEELPLDLPKLYVQVKCRAHVIDTMCELSAQKVFLPPTPCYSHSIVSLYLRCPNRSSNPGCYCGKIQGVENNPYKQCISRFQFFVDRRELDVQPRTGDISIGQDVKVYLVLRPVLRTGEVMKAAAEIKRYEAREKLIEDWRLKSFKKLADKICTEGETKQLTRTKSANTKSKNKENKNDVTTGATDDVTQSCFSEPVKEPEMKINPAKLKINAKDIFAAKKNLLETMETHGFETTVKCLIETQFLKTGKVRRETLKCRVLCPIVRPDIIVETPDEEPVLKFGRTAIGSKKVITVKVHNVSRTRIRVKHSLLNPIGPFTCPLSIPLSQMDEFFEVSTVKTIFSLNAKGEGIVPKYKIIPEFGVQYLEADEEKTTECVIVVHNECNAPLTFCMWKLYTRVGIEPEEPLVESEVEKSRTENDQRSKKEKPKDKKTQSGTNGEKGKTKKGNYDTALKPHMMEALEKTFAKGEDVMESVFVESGAVTLLPKRKGQLSIKFTPCRVEEKQTAGNPTNGTPADIQLKSVSKGRNKSKGHSRKKDGKNAKEENKSEPEAKRVYVCKYSVTVGVLPVAEWIFWGRVNTPPAKMRKKTKKKK
ncbi:hypothetical protein AAG570_006796 [Ranatra chinensis]|uniref:Uncharacterized protein n=1 Tax=Ranatra chinensis TaxID=642074 RepID=A0ABD0YX82_9HEMI